jgi:hypothetical protein
MSSSAHPTSGQQATTRHSYQLVDHQWVCQALGISVQVARAIIRARQEGQWLG